MNQTGIIKAATGTAMLLAGLLVALMVAGCGTLRSRGDGSLAGLKPGATLSSLSAEVEISYRTPVKSGSVRGLLVYRSPDRFRVVLLSPLGSTVLEAALAGEELTLLYPSQQSAFRGAVGELPQMAGYSAWRLLPWVFALPAETLPESPAVRQYQGRRETVRMADGVVVEKALDSGERVRYAGHRVVQGVALPMEYEIESADGSWVRLRLDEPEVNGELSDRAFVPNLQGVRLFPLSILREEGAQDR